MADRVATFSTIRFTRPPLSPLHDGYTSTCPPHPRYFLRTQAAIRERSLSADNLATAHSDYAKSVARYQSSSGENVNGGPPLEVVQAGDKVVWASDAFAEAHGRAEEALTELLEERGRCLRQAASSVCFLT